MAPETDQSEETRRSDDLMIQAIRRIHSVFLGIVFGILFGLLIFVATIILMIKGGEEIGPHLGLLGQFFPGYAVTWGGSFVGGLYGFATGFLGGWLIGWVYNALISFKSHLRR